jgi:hypothetical protein
VASGQRRMGVDEIDRLHAIQFAYPGDDPRE